MKKVVIFGATSSIAEHVARRMASDGLELVLVGRNEQKLEAVVADLQTRGATIAGSIGADLCEVGQHAALYEQIQQFLPDFDTIFIAHGTLADQERAQKDFSEASAEIHANFISQASLASHAANIFEDKGSGLIALISSVAGDRGRKSNYIYGSAKGALTLFAAGLRNRLSDSGVQVLTIKPGFVSTPMTEHLEQGALFASADKVGADIYKAMKARKDVLYTPWFWRYIMLIIKHIPECIFKRMSI